MFKKNPTRPPISISLKKTSQGYRIVPSESFQLFTTKKIIRSIYRPDLIQMSSQHIEGGANTGTLASGTMIQPPSHVTLPAVAYWFKQDQIHEIEKEYFPEYFRAEINSHIFSFSVKNSNLYTYYRNSMVSMWRENAKKYLSPSLCRKNLLGDVSSIMRIHAFLQNWGLINFPSKQHNKGILMQKPDHLDCYVCQASQSRTYYVAEIEQIMFQICQHCFSNDCYPQSIRKAQFRRVFYQNHTNPQKEMQQSQIIRMLEIINGIPNGAPKDKDRDTWSVIQKQFPQISKEKILKTFLKLPLTAEMNAHIFQNNEDYLQFQNEQLKQQIEKVQQPSVFEDFQNPILGSIAYMHFQMKKSQLMTQEKDESDDQETLRIEHIQQQKEFQQTQLYRNILEACQKHAKKLCNDQQRKIKELTKMLIEVVISRLQLKSLFISEYQKLVKAEQNVGRNLIKNNLAECLQYNVRAICEVQNGAIDHSVHQPRQKTPNKINDQSNDNKDQEWNDLAL